MMDKREYERLAPQIWAMFAAATLADARNANNAGVVDDMLTAFEVRFVQRECNPDEHLWVSGAEGAFAGLTEHCSKCGVER